jgi:TetR/AcrR family transcriptional regulator, fatty acid metabolism regulator protein
MRNQFTERQIQIFNASIKLIGNGGIQTLTTKNLANEIGISEPAIYRHFSSKVDILKGLLAYLKITILNRLKRVSNEKISPIKKIEKIILEQSKVFSDRPEIVVVLLSEGLYQNEKELSDIVYSIMQESAAFYKAIIEEGQEKGEIRSDIDSKQLTFIIMGTLRFNVIQWHLSGFSINLKERCSQLFEIICKLILNK